MITEGYFVEKISEIQNMKQIKITRDAAKQVFTRFKEFEPKDLDNAIENLIFTDQRFDFTGLLRNMNQRRADRLENESERNRIHEGHAAQRFFDETRYTGKCDRDKCQGCPKLKNCQIRGREWIKGINLIMANNRGQKGADELIHYMQYEFMGGIKSV